MVIQILLDFNLKRWKNFTQNNIKMKVLLLNLFYIFFIIFKNFTSHVALQSIQMRAFEIILEINSRYENCHSRHFMYAPCVQWVLL